MFQKDDLLKFREIYRILWFFEYNIYIYIFQNSKVYILYFTYEKYAFH